MLFRTRDLLVRQRTQLINALRGHLTTWRRRPAGTGEREGPCRGNRCGNDVPAASRRGVLASFSTRSTGCRRRSPNSRRRRFRKPRAERQCVACKPCRAWDRSPRWRLRLSRRRWPFQTRPRLCRLARAVPRQHSTGGKPLLGKISKMSQRDIRRLLIIGAMAVVRLVSRKAGPEGSWLHRLLARKPRMLSAIALANKMARAIWAMLTRGEDYRVPAAACADPRSDSAAEETSGAWGGRRTGRANDRSDPGQELQENNELMSSSD